MQTKVSNLFNLLCGSLLLLISCKGILDPSYITQNTLTFTADLNNASYIIISQCNDYTKWEVVSESAEFGVEPVFSPNKRYITYLNGWLGGNDNNVVVLYDLYNKSRKSWVEYTDKLDQPYLLAGNKTPSE